MENIAMDLNSAGLGGTPVSRAGDVMSGLMALIGKVPMASSAPPLYQPRDVVTPTPILEPQQHIQQSPVYEPRKVSHRPVAATRADKRQPDPWALTPEADLPAMPNQLGGTTAARATLPGETHAVAAAAQRETKSMLDLFV